MAQIDRQHVLYWQMLDIDQAQNLWKATQICMLSIVSILK